MFFHFDNGKDWEWTGNYKQIDCCVMHYPLRCPAGKKDCVSGTRDGAKVYDWYLRRTPSVSGPTHVFGKDLNPPSGAFASLTASNKVGHNFQVSNYVGESYSQINPSSAGFPGSIDSSSGPFHVDGSLWL